MVVDHLRSKFADKDDIGVSFAYCSHQERTKQTPVTLIVSLLKQLVQERPALCELVMPLYKNHRKYNTSPTLPEVSEALQRITAQYKRVFVVVDALDECQEDYGFRDHLLEELGSLDSQVSLLLTSCPHISVEYDFERAVPIEIRAREVDLRKYFEQRTDSIDTPSSICETGSGIEDCYHRDTAWKCSWDVPPCPAAHGLDRRKGHPERDPQSA
jgi:hypothetical protein